MARSTSNGKGSKHAPPGPERLDKSPERMGILSFTLAPSSASRWILPARIRCQRRNDVVFIGTTHVQLREFHDNGQLSDVTAKLDFGVQIVGAKVISAQVEKIPRRDQITNQEYDEERFTVNGRELPNEQPPQIVVLATARNELVYLYARKSSTTHEAEFVFAKRGLLEDVSIPKTNIRLMAVDPESNIMAVVSFNACTVFSLKDVHELKSSIDAWEPREPQSFQPYLEQRMFRVDGHILKIDFLRASKEEPQKAILLFIVANEGNTLLLPYQWDTREPLDQIQPMTGVIRSLPQDDNFPHLLIPTIMRRSFVIITGKNAYFYDNIKSLTSRPRVLPMPESEKGAHVWVQWAKPTRHDMFNQMKEDILLLREDGYTYLCNRHHNPPTGMGRQFSPGAVHFDIDSAVCMLPGPRLLGGDILIVGGSMNDGGVFHLAPRKEFELKQILPNSNPIHDWAMVDSNITKQKHARPRRTFVMTGPHGSSNLNELRFGQEGQISWILPVTDGGTINRLWTLEHVTSKTLFILASHHEHTTALTFDLLKEQVEELDSASFPGLNLEGSTLAAAMLPSDISIHITTTSISVGFETSCPTLKPLTDCVCADIACNNGTFATVSRVDLAYCIRIGLVRQLDELSSIVFSTEQYDSRVRPLCLRLFTFIDSQYLAVGYADGVIEVLSIDAEGGLVSACKLEPTDENTSPITSIVLLGFGVLPHALVLAGTRDGKVKAVKLVMRESTEADQIGLELHRTYQISETPVTVVAEDNDTPLESSGALITGGSRLDRIVCFNNRGDVDYSLVNVWLSDSNNPTYPQPMINAVQRIRHLESIDGGIPSRYVICATNEEVLTVRLIEQEQIVPRRLALDSKGAGLMIYSKFLDKFIIASNPEPSSSEVSSETDMIGRASTLCVVDSDKVMSDTTNESRIVLGNQDELVKVMMPWEPTDGNEHYNLIMVGLSDSMNSRIGFVSARKLASSPEKTTFKQLMKFANRSIRALCAVDKSSLAISVGVEIFLIRLDLRTKQWHEDGRYLLPSPALSLSSQGTVIYAATEQHSTIVLNWQKVEKRWEQLITDHEAKNTKIVLPFGRHGDHFLVAVAVNQGTSVLAYPAKKNGSKKPMPLFEAEMPLAVDHLKRIPSSWADNVQYAFQGISQDGTIFVFQTLTFVEWRLLRFIEELSHPDPSKAARTEITLLSEKMARNYIRATKTEHVTTFNPKKMHINGDMLKRLVEGGPNLLRDLLGSKVKVEDEMQLDDDGGMMPTLQSVARPVVGDASDMSGAVIAWIRRLLRATIF